MANVVLPFTFTDGPGNTASGAQVSQDFAAILAQVNGNLDAANMAASAKPATLMGTWRTIYQASQAIAGGSAAGTYWLPSTGSAPVVSGATTTGVGQFTVVNPADYAVSGLTTRFRLRVIQLQNSTSPGAVTFTYGLYPITSTIGGAGAFGMSFGSLIAGSAIAGPAGGGSAFSADFAISALNFYSFGVVVSGIPAANSLMTFNLALDVHNV